MFKLRVTCDKITGSLLELFELQPLIQTAQALGQVGPQRELRNNILHIKQQYQLQASSESTENSMLSAGRAGFDDDDLEHCPHCDQWFAFGTLDFHQDLCSEIIVQKEDFAPRESRSKEKPRGRKKLRELEEAEATKAPSMDVSFSPGPDMNSPHWVAILHSMGNTDLVRPPRFRHLRYGPVPWVGKSEKTR
jgi:hypothetical protein